MRGRRTILGFTVATAIAACSSGGAPGAPADAGPNLDDWDRPIVRPSDETANDARAACTYARGALPGETLGESVPVDRDIPIETIVVLMQENRSFDSYFAHLGAYAKRTDIDGAPDTATNPDRIGGAGTVFTRFQHAPHLCTLDTNHEWAGTHLEYDQGKMDGFVQANTDFGTPPPNAPPDVTTADRTMWWLDERDIPFYYALAATFAIGDRYFSSLLGPTWPNRDYLYMATSLGITNESLPDLGPWPFPTRDLTIFDLLEKRHVRWNVYADGLPPETTSVGPAYVNRWGRDPLLKTQDFFDQAAAGTLPQVVFVDAFFGRDGPSGDDEHPPADVQIGQQLVSKIVHALFASPQWKSVALFFTYDEHGGFYDHVPPPPACPPDVVEPVLPPGDATGGHFDRYGVRVPFVLVSPYAKKGFTSHVVHDHASITRFIETKFRLPALTARDANADPLLEMFDFQHPPFMTPPTIDEPPLDMTELGYCVSSFGK